jgi:A/G-specific adenine glycosylase
MRSNRDEGPPSLSGPTGGPLLAWFDREKRDLPWRRTRDPYAIWVSEIMLQQTQVVTVIPYWLRWMERFPTVESLAAADEQDVLSLWQGLGYYRRCRMLLQGAKWVAINGMPATAEALEQVPGIGKYTAGAIASIAFDAVAPVVDGNVERVYARLTGDASAGKELKDAAWKWAARNLFKKRPGDWNQALMELGATICKPAIPDCKRCPLMDQCVAFQSWRVEDLPTKPPKVQIVRLKQLVWVPIYDGSFGVRQILAGQWWEGMWEFPRADADDSLESEQLRAIVGAGWRESVGRINHSVTQHRIGIEVSFVRCEMPSTDLRWLTQEELLTLPMAAPQRKILKLVLAQLGL